MPSPTPTRRALLICNPISGGGRGRVLGPALAAALRARGVEAECHLTTAAGDGRARAAAAAHEPFDALVAIGGDGTVNEVLNGMPDPTRAIGVLPIGTANVLAIELALPKRIDAAADVIAAGRVRELAIGEAAGRRFLLFCGAGVDGAVVHRLSQVRSGTLGKHKWAAPILHTLWHWPQHRLRATFADGEVLDDLSSVLVTRVRNYGGVLHLVPEVHADSGQLHVLCFRHRTRRAWLWLGLRGVTRRLRADARLLVRTTTRVHVEGAARYQLDGDHGGDTPVTISLLPHRARILAPQTRP